MTDGNVERSLRAHGAVLKIIGLRWLSDTSVEAETDITKGLTERGASVPYLLTLQSGHWTAQEDVRREWWQSTQKGAMQEAVLRYELAQGIYGMKPDKMPCYLSFGTCSRAVEEDPPDTFLARFTQGPVRLQKASKCPKGSRKPWIIFDVQHVRWISDTEAGIESGGTCSHFVSAEADNFQVTCSKNGWDVKLLSIVSA